MNKENLNIEDFREFLEITKATYNDDQLDRVLKTAITALWIMYEQGHRMPKKALIELQNYI